MPKPRGDVEISSSHPATYKFIDATDIPQNLAQQKHIKL